MVSRVIVLLIVAFSFLNATILKDAKISDTYLNLYFDVPLKKEQLKAFIISKKNLTKYVFDLKGVKKLSKVPSKYLFSGNLKAIRISQFTPKSVRVVIDSKVKYNLRFFQRDNESILHILLPLNIKIEKVLYAKKKKPKTLKKPQKRKKAVTKTVSKKKQKQKKTSLNSAKLFKNLQKEEKLSRSKINLDLTKPTIKSKYLIYLDPGHGGSDPGAYIAGVKEKDIVLQIAKRVYRKLKARGYRVKMTRYKDKAVGLWSRAKKANRANADVFVSIHANAAGNHKKSVRGLETYFLQKNKSARAKRLAKIENRALLKSKDKTTQNVLLNAIFTGPRIEFSHRLAISVQREVLNSVRKVYPIKDNGVDGANFKVLAATQVPAILVEVGYLTNKRERRLLKTKKYQEKIADGIVKGIIQYLKYKEHELN